MLRRGLLVTVALAQLGGGLAAIAPSASARSSAPVRGWTSVATRSAGDRHGATTVRFAGDRVAHAGSVGDRIVAIAKRYVGKVPYRNGGDTPKQGFDCSGYTKYAYAQAHVATLPHNTQAQRTARGMRRISAARARPGDLIFYLSGRSAYHVAIYAGHHMQYAAATPKDGIRYQQVYSSNVVYGTDWH